MKGVFVIHGKIFPSESDKQRYPLFDSSITRMTCFFTLDIFVEIGLTNSESSPTVHIADSLKSGLDGLLDRDVYNEQLVWLHLPGSPEIIDLHLNILHRQG